MLCKQKTDNLVLSVVWVGVVSSYTSILTYLVSIGYYNIQMHSIVSMENLNLANPPHRMA